MNFSKMLNGKMPVEFDEKTAEELDLYSLEKIEDEISEVNGFFMATEEYNAQLYQQAIKRQLHARIEKWRETATRPASSFEYDYDEVWDACIERDELEYIRAAISVIQMSEDVETRQPRLPDVDYNFFRKLLGELDVNFRKIIEYDKKKGHTYREPISPRTFWWRN